MAVGLRKTTCLSIHPCQANPCACLYISTRIQALFVGGVMGTMHGLLYHHPTDAMQVVRMQKHRAAARAYHSIDDDEKAIAVILSVLCASAMYYSAALLWAGFSRLWSRVGALIFSSQLSG